MSSKFGSKTMGQSTLDNNDVATVSVNDGEITKSSANKMQRKRPSSPESIGITPDMQIIDLTHTPTDTSPREEIQGITFHDLDRSGPNSTTPFPVAEDEQPHSPTEPTIIATNRSIRFLSRVRITSGVHRKHRPKINFNAEGGAPGDDEERNTAVSSRSSSPSSSISAPIRFREDEPGVSSKWGPLGQRVQLFVSQQREKARQLRADRDARIRGREAKDRRRRYLLVYGIDADADAEATSRSGEEEEGASERRRRRRRRMHERSPLLGGSHGHGQRQQKAPAVDDEDGEDAQGYHPETEADYQAGLNHEIDMIFGKWPGRLLNYQWWWWQLRPIVCCADDWEEARP